MARKGNNPDILPYDPANENSIYHMVPESVQQAMQLINPVWLCWKEATLEKNCEADAKVIRIRLSFWDEYFAAKDQDRKMSMRRVWNGTCSERYWYEGILASPKKMAYLLSMPSDYEASIRAAHYMALSRLEDILTFPLKTKGVPNLGVADRVIKVFEILDNRIKGVAMQRMQVSQKSVNVNITAGTKDVTSSNNPAEIEAEIERLEKEMIKKLPATEAKLVQAVEVKTTEENHGE